MAFLLADRVQETTTTTGTGTITLAGAVTGFQSFAAIGNGNTTFYTIADQTGSNWEVGIGTYTSSGTTLSRDTVLSSSNSGSLVNFSAGTKNVFVTYPAGRAAYGLTAGSNITLTPGNGIITIAASGGVPYGLFYKTDSSTVAFTKTGAGTAQIKAGTRIEVGGTTVTFSSATSITMPTLTAGTDYAIWVKDDATIQATSNYSSAPSAGNWRRIGGFHYAPGGNATGTSGGNTTPAINEYSFWDLKFRPACPDPRGMALVADSFWADIYLLGVDHLTNGTSAYNVTIADGSSPPKIPTKFGGNGTAIYGAMTWWNTNDVLRSYGKRSPAYDEFAALAYGTTEASSGGTDPVSTILRNTYTSKWGIMLATGNMWVWGANFGGGAAAASYAANTGGRGSTYQMENVALFGGAWTAGSVSGSRSSTWNNSPTASVSSVGARGVCDHLILD